MAAPLSKADYLKKYLSSSETSEKKKRRKKRIQEATEKRGSGLVIVDEDIGIRSNISPERALVIVADADDEAPQVAAVVDERPSEVQLMEQYRQSGRWKTLAENATSDGDRPDRPGGTNPAPRHINDPDESPPRRQRHDSDGSSGRGNQEVASAQRQRHDSDAYPAGNRRRHDSDSSPRRQQSDSDASPTRHARHDSDCSPPRHQERGADPQSRLQGSQSGSDVSPPRTRPRALGASVAAASHSQPLSPQSKRTLNSADVTSTCRPVLDHFPKREAPSTPDSCPQPQKRRNDAKSSSAGSRNTASSELPGRTGRSDSGSSYRGSKSLRDESHAHRQQDTGDQSAIHRQQDTGDLSPIRRPQVTGDLSPVRRRQVTGDLSPVRRRQQSADGDMSPPRHHREQDSGDVAPRFQGRADPRAPAAARHGATAATSSDAANSEQSKSGGPGGHGDRKHASQAAVTAPRSSLDKTLDGKKAGLSDAKSMRAEADALRQKELETFKQIGDDLLGRNAKTVFRDASGKQRDSEKEAAEKRKMDDKRAQMAAQYSLWGKGLKQVEDRQQRAGDVQYEMSKPLARYKDDVDLDAMLREKERAGDPMLAFMRSKKERGDDGSDRLPASKQRYSGPAPPPNRFNLWPGYRWDGVDRSNGFEKQYFSNLNNKKAVEEQAYKWSTEDM